MKNYKSLLLLTLLLLLINFTVVSAEDDIRFYHEFGTNLTIYEKCRVDGAICDSSYSCNISVLSPSQSLIINNQPMLGVSVYRNFTLNSTLTVPNGIYESTVDCTNVTLSGSNTFFYQITPNGSKPIDVGQGLILGSSILILLLISLYSGYLGIKSTNTTIMLSFLALSIMLIIFSLGFALNIIELSFGTFSTIISNYSTAYILFIALVSVGAISLIIYLVVVALNFYHNMRGMNDNFSVK